MLREQPAEQKSVDHIANAFETYYLVIRPFLRKYLQSEADHVIIVKQGVIAVEVKGYDEANLLRECRKRCDSYRLGNRANPGRQLRQYIDELKCYCDDFDIFVGGLIVFPTIRDKSHIHSKIWDTMGGKHLIIDYAALNDKKCLRERILASISAQKHEHPAQKTFRHVDDTVANEIHRRLIHKISSEVLDFKRPLRDIETDENQERVIYTPFMENNMLLVEGTAGSGKTLVAIRRIESFKRKYPGKTACYVCYNRPLAEDIRKKIKGRAPSYSFYSLIYSEAKRLKLIPANLKVKSTQDLLPDVLKETYREYPELRGILRRYDEDFLRWEIEWIFGNGLLDEKRYMHSSRKGRYIELDETSKMSMWILFEALCARIKQLGIETWDTLPLRLLEVSPEVLIKFDFLAIDEGNDFHPHWIELLSEMVREGGSGLLLFERPQSLFRFGTDFASALKKKTLQVERIVLDTNYRTPEVIFNYYCSPDPVLEKEIADFERFPKKVFSRFKGIRPPMVQGFKGENQEIYYIAKRIREISSSYTVAIIYGGTEDKSYEQRLREKIGSREVTISTLGTIKGLEYHYIFISRVNNDVIPPVKVKNLEGLSRYRRQFNVAITRCKEGCFITYTDRPSSLLKDLKLIR